MRRHIAPQLAILLDGPRTHAVYTCRQSQFLTDWWNQQVALDCISASPRCTGQLRGKAERRVAEVSRVGTGCRAGRGPWGASVHGAQEYVRIYVYACSTPLIDGWATQRGPR